MLVFYVILNFSCILFTDCSQNGLDHPSVDMSLEDSSGILVDGFERTYDGKLKCRYCNYATRGTARLIEHIRIHTGNKVFMGHIQGIIFTSFCYLACFRHQQERNPTAATFAHLLRPMSATWKLTCDHTQVRSRTSVSCAPSAAATVATCHTIAADATNSSP